MEYVLALDNVKKKIKGQEIIKGLSFSVKKGEIFGLLGPNGAGKTTTIRMIVGLMEISSGDIIVCGKSVKKDFSKAIQQIGAIVENPEMYKFLTGYQNLLQYARMQKNISREKIAEVVELVGLNERIHDKVKTYSLGMRQRLGLAQCLLHDPQLLILDEPTNGLDPAGIREIRDYLRKLTHEKGMSVIVSSHLLSEMEMMCDRIAIIQKGELKEVQEVNSLINDKHILYAFETGSLGEAMQWLQKHYELKKVDSGFTIKCQKTDIPAIINQLIERNIAIYSVKPISKTLEDHFLEVTAG
ncbi:ABC transporter ATP-binding protein [Cytobacillus sp.]|uniref:ABC transporter ATP-binding protein n=1 Tax=Cytobacillus sp. TaxID=2675269 RepID=UPI0028BD6DD1|nr:ABC transporter ATP-binding protein [Cytobacillus sp.]